jgi:hypothetical protein
MANRIQTMHPHFGWEVQPKKIYCKLQNFSIFSWRGCSKHGKITHNGSGRHIAHDWYTSLKPLLISSWQQLKAELLATFQGYQPGAKTIRDILNCI